MEAKKTFKTRTGFCHVTPEQIILTRDGIIGNISRVTVGSKATRILIVYGLVTLGVIYFAHGSFIRGDMATGLFFGLIGLYLIYGILKSRNNSAKPIIDRKDIKKVTYHSGISGLTRPRFVVEFNDNGQMKKRFIILHGTLIGGQREADKAVQVMRDEELLN